MSTLCMGTIKVEELRRQLDGLHNDVGSLRAEVNKAKASNVELSSMVEFLSGLVYRMIERVEEVEKAAESADSSGHAPFE